MAVHHVRGYPGGPPMRRWRGSCPLDLAPLGAERGESVGDFRSGPFCSDQGAAADDSERLAASRSMIS